MFFPDDPVRNTICWIIGIAIILFTVWALFLIVAGSIELDRKERRNKGKTDLADVLWWINTFGFCPYSLSDHDEDPDESNRTSGAPRQPGPASLPSSDSPAQEEQDPPTISYPSTWESASEEVSASSREERS